MSKVEERPDAGWLKRSIETGTAFVENHQEWAKVMKANWLNADSQADPDQPKADNEAQGNDPSPR